MGKFEGDLLDDFLTPRKKITLPITTEQLKQEIQKIEAQNGGHKEIDQKNESVIFMRNFGKQVEEIIKKKGKLPKLPF